MFIRVFRCLWLVGTVALLFSACSGVDQKRAAELANSQYLATPPTADLNRDLALLTNPGSIGSLATSSGPVEPRDYEIGPEDLLEVTLFNVDEQKDGLPGKVQVRVSQTGFVTLPLVGKLQVRGLSAVALEQSLHQKYGEYMHDPDVGVKIVENRSQFASVLGAVGKPGVFELSAPKKLRDLLAMAGGIKEDAGIFVHVSRSDSEDKQMYIINLHDLARDPSGELNVPIHGGDVINVPLAGTFFVDGYIGKPGSYPLVREYTLTQALALAGGIEDSQAKSSDITIFRRDAEGAVQTIKCNLSKIQALEAEDVRIAENDVVVVPASLTKIVITRVLGSIGLGVRDASGFNFAFGSRGSGASRY